MLRDLSQLESLKGNTFFLAALLMMQSGPFLPLVIAALVLFPLSGDPLGKIPAIRLALWPLSRRDSILLRFASLWFSPAAWITLAIMFWLRQPAAGLGFLGVTILFAFASSRVPTFDPLRIVPGGGLIRKNLRELLSLLDPYLGFVLSLSGVLYRILSDHPDPDALRILSLMIVLALSTHALSLFGLESAAGFTRYRLLPLRGWRILVAKDAAFFIVLAPLVLALAPLSALAAALPVLAVGHYASLENPAVHRRWRFTGGATLGPAVVQIFLLFGAGIHPSALVLAACLLLYLASLWYCGRLWDRAA